MLEALLAAIRSAAFTGEEGDGKVFVERIQEVVRVRTWERQVQE
jgi:nitrogen regulatory protein PII